MCKVVIRLNHPKEREVNKMGIDFGKFEKLVNQADVNKAINDAPQYEDVPKGTYRGTINKLEITTTKAGDKLMLVCAIKITETINAPKKQDNRLVFMNKPFTGCKTSEKWNDAKAVASVIGWLNVLLHDDEKIEFSSYSQLADDVLDVFQNVCPAIEVEFDYDPDAFYSVTIKDVLE